MSRSAIDGLIKVVKPYGARGLAWFKVNEDGWQGPIVKFLSEEEKKTMTERLELEVGDVAFVADQAYVTNPAYQPRLHFGDLQGLRKDDDSPSSGSQDFPCTKKTWKRSPVCHVSPLYQSPARGQGQDGDCA